MNYGQAPAPGTEQIIAAIWCELLEREEVGALDNFFEVGGYSMLMEAVREQIVDRLGLQPTLTDLFKHATVRSSAAFLDGVQAEPGRPAAETSGDHPETAIAVIGMSCRFPDAADIDQFWDNLVAGLDSVTRLAPGTVAGPGGTTREYVPAGGVLRDPEWFDPEYFGYTPREAALLDPQHRIFLECAVEAIEAAGYDPDRFPGLIGVYAGCGESSYAEILRERQRETGSISGWDLRIGTSPDYLASKVAYKLGLRGPAAAVQAACATSLYAVHLAARSLLAGDCDLVLAGGTTVRVPADLDRYQVGGITSPTGACRPFDEGADGVVTGDGCGIVVLKRLAEAIADGDHIHAVLRGSAVNNDGRERAGFTAPGVRGQVEVVRAAQRSAGVQPSTITYIEAHGTGTRVGDPIEFAGLHEVFAGEGPRAEPCWLGSVKSNIGHTDAAAGVAGFIKTVLAVERGVIPPSLHYTRPNPDIDFTAGPFAVVTEPRPWSPKGLPRRAGVTARGLGGGNAHAVLEQPPLPRPSTGETAEQLLPLSARTPAALNEVAARLAEHLARHPEQELRDVAWTLQTGRREHGNRRYVVVRDRAEAVRVLTGDQPGEHGGSGPLAALGERWLAGEPVDWSQVHNGAPRRVPLPGYPFQRKPYLLEARAAREPVAPMPIAGLGIEDTVSLLFTELLGISDIDSQESFFDLGGDSLVATRLLTRVGQLLPVELELRSMYLAPSIRELTTLIKARLREGAAAHG
ncbi:beta-ketoacyl synthase N-terminal-like domain-containing protein [Amycolatopsis sp. NPDC051071]|uniref:type I polyketide synthase n=1 Tax=Amycolatopsis sp. NPDC051071 TaxID=3154637 RepID=UPI0034403437